MENKLDFFFLSLSCVLFFVGTVLTREGSSYYTSALRILFKRRDETGRRPIQIWIRPLRLQPACLPFGKEGLLDKGRDKRSEVFNFTGIRDMYVSLESSIGERKVGTHTHTHIYKREDAIICNERKLIAKKRPRRVLY